MTREPYSDPSQWHDLARLVVNERLESASRTIYCEDRDRQLQARYYPLEDALYLEESAEDFMFGWHTIAEYEGPDLPDLVRGDRATFVDALRTYDRGAKTRERVRPDIEFADLETHAHLIRCKSCDHREVVAGGIGDACRDCCDEVNQYGSPLIDRNTAVDLASAPFEERLAELEDGPVRDEVLALYETLFPPWDEREVSDSGE